MLIKKCELEHVCGITSKLPKTKLDEYVLCGRSNVGKSSFINAFINRKSYAKVSSTPGKTKTINYYNVNDKFYLVDLPGYGYASSGHKDQNEWKDLIDKYFEVGKNINEIILLVDIRIEPTDKDVQMFSFILGVTGYEPIVIATKLDKIKKTQVSKNIETIRTKLNASKDCDIIAYSSETKEGLDKIYKYFEDDGEV